MESEMQRIYYIDIDILSYSSEDLVWRRPGG